MDIITLSQTASERADRTVTANLRFACDRRRECAPLTKTSVQPCEQQEHESPSYRAEQSASSDKQGLQAGAGWLRAGSLNLLQEPRRPLCGRRRSASCLRTGRRALHGGRDRRWRIGLPACKVAGSINRRSSFVEFSLERRASSHASTCRGLEMYGPAALFCHSSPSQSWATSLEPFVWRSALTGLSPPGYDHPSEERGKTCNTFHPSQDTRSASSYLFLQVPH